jgi:hypothetical protein
MSKINCLPETKWKHKDHIATPANITKQMLAESYDLRYTGTVRKSKSAVFKPRAQSHSKVKYIIKDGKEVDL